MDTKKLRQKILDLAIRGKLVPQDPNDEPASVLLERIRAEKERLIKEGKIKRSKKSAAEEEIEAPFEIPESWEWTTVGNVCETCLGKMLDKQKNQGVLHPYLRNINVRWGNFDLSDLLQMPFEDSETERYSICYDDLVVCEGGEPGRCAIWKDNKPIRFQKALHRVRCYKGISNYFLQTVLRLFFENGMLEMYYTGSTIKHLTGDSLNSIVIPLPPEKEQIRIVSLVEKWFAVIDELESNEGDLLKAIDQAKSKILDLAIHGKLVPQEGEWKEQKIKDAFIINPKNKETDDKLAGFVPMSNIQDGYRDSYVCETKPWGTIKKGFTHFADGDIAVAKISPCLENRKSMVLANLPNGIGAGTTELIVFRCKEDVIPKYGLFFFKTQFFIDSCVGTFNGVVGQQRVGKNIVEEIIIPLPPFNEQKRIVAKIEELFAVLDSIKESLK